MFFVNPVGYTISNFSSQDKTMLHSQMSTLQARLLTLEKLSPETLKKSKELLESVSNLKADVDRIGNIDLDKLVPCSQDVPFTSSENTVKSAHHSKSSSQCNPANQMDSKEGVTTGQDTLGTMPYTIYHTASVQTSKQVSAKPKQGQGKGQQPLVHKTTNRYSSKPTTMQAPQRHSMQRHRSSVPPVQNFMSMKFVNLRYISSMDQSIITAPILSMAYAHGVGLVLLQEGYNQLFLSLYKKSTRFQMAIEQAWGGHYTSEIGFLYSAKCKPFANASVNCLVGLNVSDTGTKLLCQHDFLTMKDDGLHRQTKPLDGIVPCKDGGMSQISCGGDFVFYALQTWDGTWIVCLNHTPEPGLTVVWTSLIPHFTFQSMCCAPRQGYNSPFIVCTAGENPDSNTALIARHESNTLWTKTFTELDRAAPGFSLVDIVFDGKQIFVLNAYPCCWCLYVISVDGTRVNKVWIDGKYLNVKQGGWKMTVDRDEGILFIANEDHTIDIYQIEGHL